MAGMFNAKVHKEYLETGRAWCGKPVAGLHTDCRGSMVTCRSCKRALKADAAYQARCVKAEREAGI
jgi:hypothetical protein